MFGLPAYTLIQPHLTLHRIKNLLRVKADAVLEHCLHLPDLFDVLLQVAIDEHQVRLLSYINGANSISSV